MQTLPDCVISFQSSPEQVLGMSRGTSHPHHTLNGWVPVGIPDPTAASASPLCTTSIRQAHKVLQPVALPSVLAPTAERHAKCT